MSTFSSVMMALAGPLAKKVLTSLGIGLLTYAGVDTAVTAGINAVKSNFAGIPVDLISIIARFGYFTAFSIIAGGVVAGVSMMTFSKFAKLT